MALNGKFPDKQAFSNPISCGIIKDTMSSQVFYRKWRPQTLSEVVGQQHVTETLRRSIVNGRVAHAYLFCGPRGTGKTSTGRILAKAINCLEPVNGEPCNNCALCQAFNAGSALDIIEIDAASNRGIDEIRELKERVNYAPAAAKYKVYIIDEVHMITKEGFNAFLKTLEEPPPHAIFVLATTDPHKVLATILSRCQRFDFHRLSQSAVISKLEFVCGKEGIKIEPEGLRLIARVSTGSLRDAENLLEQLVAYFGHEISLPQVQSMLGITNDPRTVELVKQVLTNDITASLKTINAVSADGLDLQQFNREMVNYLRDLLLVKTNSDDAVDVTSEELGELKKTAANISLDGILTAIKFFGEVDFRQNNYSTLPIELAIVNTVLAASGEKPAEIKAKPVENVEAGVVKTAKAAYAPPQKEKPAKETAAVAKESPVSEVKLEPEAATEKVAEKPVAAKIEDKPPAENKGNGYEEGVEEIAIIRNEWRHFINALRGEGSTGNLDAFMRSACEALSIENNVITIGFYHQFHRDYINDPKYKFLVEKKLREVFDKPYKINCIIIERKKEAKAPVREEPDTQGSLAEIALKRGAKIIGQKPNTEET
jgi:DNA polymerase-3 subunit gamma/tau